MLGVGIVLSTQSLYAIFNYINDIHVTANDITKDLLVCV